MPAAEVDKLRVTYGERVAVDEVSFDVQAGEVVALLGRNGAGKTSIVETLEGYRAPASGSVRVLGLDPRADHSSVVAKLGVVLQKGGTYPVMSPARVLKLFASYYDEPRSPGELLAVLGLERVESTPCKRLSGGEAQRLALALALVGKPSVLFLDEPTAGVDPEGRIAVRDVIASEREQGTAVLVTSHELDEVERVADRVVIIDEGVVVAAGTPGELGGGGGELCFAVEGELDTGELSLQLKVAVVVDAPGRYRIGGPVSPALVAELTAWLATQGLVVSGLRIGHERLEDVFLRLVGRQS